MPGIEAEAMPTLMMLDESRNKYIRNFSSGMKQRVKLAISLLCESNFILLDEPGTNLDESGIKWYKELISKYKGERILILCSNRKTEYEICDKVVDIIDYK